MITVIQHATVGQYQIVITKEVIDNNPKYVASMVDTLASLEVAREESTEECVATEAALVWAVGAGFRAASTGENYSCCIH